MKRGAVPHSIARRRGSGMGGLVAVGPGGPQPPVKALLGVRDPASTPHLTGSLDVTSPERYKDYIAANAVPLKKYGARFLVRNGACEVHGDALQGVNSEACTWVGITESAAAIPARPHADIV